jgi:VanZ family protein
VTIMLRKNYYLILALGWAIFIYFLMTRPLTGAESPFPGFDKLVHIFLFGILNYFLSLGWLAKGKNIGLSLIACLTACMLYAVFLENLQNNIAGRFNSIYDTIAGTGGMLIAGFYLYFKYKH